MPTSITPEAVIAAPGTGCLARSAMRNSVSLIIKSLLLPAAEQAHLLSFLAEGKDSHICMTRSFGRMTGFEGPNFINKITLNIYMVKKIKSGTKIKNQQLCLPIHKLLHFLAFLLIWVLKTC